MSYVVSNVALYSIIDIHAVFHSPGNQVAFVLCFSLDKALSVCTVSLSLNMDSVVSSLWIFTSALATCSASHQFAAN